jgi:hypothetical protein
MTDFPPAMPHGPLTEVLPDIFFVTGTMRNEFFGSMWQFNRNMTVVREGDRLTIINSVRLGEEGLAALDALGRVVNVVRIGDMHGIDDPFYVDRYGATFWALPGMRIQEGLTVDRTLRPGGEMPLGGSSLFEFRTSNRPEGILRLDRDGGILIACDALQNWLEPDAHFTEETAQTMQTMGFFTPANVGLAWMHENQPETSDFARLKGVPFRHALCGHGSPLLDTAQSDFHATFQRLFQV